MLPLPAISDMITKGGVQFIVKNMFTKTQYNI